MGIQSGKLLDFFLQFQAETGSTTGIENRKGVKSLLIRVELHILSNRQYHGHQASG